MPTPNIFPNHLVGDTLPAADWDNSFALVETSFLDHGAYVVSGLVASIGTGLSVNITAGHAVIGADINFAAGFTISSLTNATTNHLYVLQNGTGTSNTTGTPPANSAKLGTALTAGGVVTAVNMGRTAGRQQFVQPQNLLLGGMAAGITSAGHPDGGNLASWGATDAEGQQFFGTLPAGAVAGGGSATIASANNFTAVPNSFSGTAAASANNASVQLGSGGFAGGGTNFTGSASGTVLGTNVPAAFAGSISDHQQAGLPVFKVLANSSTAGAGQVLVNAAAGVATLTLARAAQSNPTIKQMYAMACPADTNLTASTEAFDINFNMSRVRGFANGNITTQRAMIIQPPAYAFVSGSNTITNAPTVAITGPPTPGSFATITNPMALWIQSGVTQLDGDVHVQGLSTAFRAVSTNATFGVTDFAIYMDATGGARTVTLPSAASVPGKIGLVKKTDVSANTVTVTAAGGDTIEGAATAVISGALSILWFQSVGGTQWYLVKQ